MERNHSVDCLKGFLILLVIIGHAISESLDTLLSTKIR